MYFYQEEGKMVRVAGHLVSFQSILRKVKGELLLPFLLTEGFHVFLVWLFLYRGGHQSQGRF